MLNLLFFFFCRIRLNFLNHLEDWTEQAAERAASVVVAKVNLFPYTLNMIIFSVIMPDWHSAAPCLWHIECAQKCPIRKLFYRAFLPCHKWVLTGENLSSGFSNNKGTYQPVYPCSLISAFIIRFLQSMISKLAS